MDNAVLVSYIQTKPGDNAGHRRGWLSPGGYKSFDLGCLNNDNESLKHPFVTV